MIWIAPSEKDTASGSLEKRRRDAADQFRAGSVGLSAGEDSGSIPGIIHYGRQFDYVRRVGLVHGGPFVLNQRLSKLVPVEAFDWMMTCGVFREPEMRAKLEQLANGVAQQSLSPALASAMEFARSLRELRQRCATLAEPVARSIVRLYSTSADLAGDTPTLGRAQSWRVACMQLVADPSSLRP